MLNKTWIIHTHKRTQKYIDIYIYTQTLWVKYDYQYISIDTTLGDPLVEGGAQYLLAPRRCHGGVEEHSSGYLWSSGKLHAQESIGSSG